MSTLPNMSGKSCKKVALAGALALASTVAALPLSARDASAADPVRFRVLTYNVRHDSGSDATTIGAGKAFAKREASVVALIRANTPGIVGLQEVLPGTKGSDGQPMAASLKTALATPTADGGKYGAIIPPSLGTVVDHKQNLIFYKDDGKFVPVSNGVFGFGTKADVAAACVPNGENFSWAIIKVVADSGTVTVFVANAHLTPDPACGAQRVYEAKQIHQQVTKNNPNSYPVIVLGDMNADPSGSEDTLGILGQGSSASTGTSYQHSYNLDPTVPLSNRAATFNAGWDTNDDAKADTSRFDYIFAGGRFTADLQKIDTTGYVYGGFTGRHSPSDHYPVFSRLTYTP